MQIQARKAGEVTILDLTGRLVIGAPEKNFSSSVRELLDAGARYIAINLGGVAALDSSGLGAMVRAHTSFAKAGGRCRFFAAGKLTLQTLKMVRLDTVLELFDDEASALAGL